jgi:hypothetical protein
MQQKPKIDDERIISWVNVSFTGKVQPPMTRFTTKGVIARGSRRFQRQTQRGSVLKDVLRFEPSDMCGIPKPTLYAKLFWHKSKTNLDIELDGGGGHTAQPHSHHDMLNNEAKCQTERESPWHSNIAVNAVDAPQNAQERDFARMRHSENICYIGRSFDFGHQICAT